MGYDNYLGIGFVNRFNRDEMNKITNDYGDEVYAVGEPLSLARVECLYPRAIQMLFDKLVNWYIQDGHARFNIDDVRDFLEDYSQVHLLSMQDKIFHLAGERFNEWLTRREDFTN